MVKIAVYIIAYKYELISRILTLVKIQNCAIKEVTIFSFKSMKRESEYWLFVLLINCTKNYQKYLDSIPIITDINGTELVDFILKYYYDLSDKC